MQFWKRCSLPTGLYNRRRFAGLPRIVRDFGRYILACCGRDRYRGNTHVPVICVSVSAANTRLRRQYCRPPRGREMICRSGAVKKREIGYYISHYIGGNAYGKGMRGKKWEIDTDSADD